MQVEGGDLGVGEGLCAFVCFFVPWVEGVEGGVRGLLGGVWGGHFEELRGGRERGIQEESSLEIQVEMLYLDSFIGHNVMSIFKPREVKVILRL